MRCSECSADKVPDQFSNTQKKKSAGARKCLVCAATMGGGATANAADASAEPRVPGGSNATAASSSSTATDPGATAAPPAVVPVCAWARCGKQLPGDPALRKRCARCKQALYCDQICQKRHWREGGHKEACVEPPCCTICLDGGDEPLPIQGGCVCRGDAGLAHVACQAEVATRKFDGFHEGWYECPTCGQDYTGAMLLGLARALVELCKRTRRPGDPHRLAAEDNLGNALREAGEFGEAAEVLARVLSVKKRVMGADHPATLNTAQILAAVHLDQGNVANAEELQVEGLAASRRVNGKEHHDTLLTAMNLANTHIRQGRPAAAEELLAMVLEVRRRVNGKEHPSTLDAATNISVAYKLQGRLAEAEELEAGLLASSQRVRGNEHPGTLTAAANLAATHSDQGKHAEAEVLELTVLEASRRVRGVGHPETLRAARNLAKTHEHLGKHAEAAELRAVYFE